jgi:hypothetical protein
VVRSMDLLGLADRRADRPVNQETPHLVVVHPEQGTGSYCSRCQIRCTIGY